MTDLTKLICDILSSGAIVAETSDKMFALAPNHVKCLCETYLPEGCVVDYDAVAEHLYDLRGAQLWARGANHDIDRVR